MISIIQNGSLNKTIYVLQKEKKICRNLLIILWNEGYILGFENIIIKGQNYYKIFLKYIKNVPAIKKFRPISKPGNRIYFTLKQIWKINYVTGLVVISTNKGLMSSIDCKKKKVGGEPLFVVE